MQPTPIPPADQNEVEQLVMLADAFTGLNHAFNNHLNAMVLQAAALQMRLPAEFRDPLDRIRKEGSQAANLFKPLMWFRQRARQTFRPMDLGDALRAFLKENANGWKFSGKERVEISASGPTLTRLFNYLLSGLSELSQESHGGTITLTSAPVMLTLEFCPGDDAVRTQLQQLAEGQENELSLAFLAARSLLRLMDGRMELGPAADLVQLNLIW